MLIEKDITSKEDVISWYKNYEKFLNDSIDAILSTENLNNQINKKLLLGVLDNCRNALLILINHYLVSNYFDNNIKIENDYVQVIEIENKKTFYRLVSDLYKIKNDEKLDEVFFYDDDNQELNMYNKVDLYVNFFDIDLNSKKNLNALNKNIINSLTDNVKEEILNNFKKLAKSFTKILSDEKALKYIMKKELKAVKDEYNVPRLTSICDTFEEIKIDTNEMIIKEDVIVLITKDGYVKRTSKRGYLSNNDAPLLKDLDYIIGLYELNTKDVVLLFTNKGNYLYLPVHEIPDIKWKVLGKHISNIIKIDENEQIIGAIPVSDFDKNKNIVLASLNGMIKKTPLNLFKVSRYTKPISCMKLKDKDEVIFVGLDDFKDINLTTNTSYNLWFSLDEVPDSGIKFI